MTLPVKLIRDLFDDPRIKSQLARAIPRHLSMDRLLRVATTVIQRNPKLLECTQDSLLACVMTFAQLGLDPEPSLGQGYMVPYFNKKKGIMEAQFIPGYRGYLTLARRSGEIQSVSSQVVKINDHFVLEYGLNECLEHRPGDGERGAAKGAYVIFRYKDGGHSFDYMTVEDIEKIRTRSKSPEEGPWQSDWDEMAKKSIIKRHIKLAPLSIEFVQAATLEDQAWAGESQLPTFKEMGALPEIIEAEQIEPNFLGIFDQKVKVRAYDQETLDEWMGLCLDRWNEKTKTKHSMKEFVADIIKNDQFEDFWSAYLRKYKTMSDPDKELEAKTEEWDGDKFSEMETKPKKRGRPKKAKEPSRQRDVGPPPDFTPEEQEIDRKIKAGEPILDLDKEEKPVGPPEFTIGYFVDRIREYEQILGEHDVLQIVQKVSGTEEISMVNKMHRAEVLRQLKSLVDTKNA